MKLNLQIDIDLLALAPSTRAKLDKVLKLVIADLAQNCPGPSAPDAPPPQCGPGECP